MVPEELSSIRETMRFMVSTTQSSRLECHPKVYGGVGHP